MQPSKEQIENAARLVPDTNNAWSRSRGIPMTTGRQVEEGGAYVIREWQPWADTEAGRSDALVLLAEVYKHAMTMTAHVCLCDSCAPWYAAIIHAPESGNVQQIQAATFAAAAAIGAHMNQGEAK